MAFKDTYPFMAFGGKIDPVSEIRNAGIVTSGNVYWVKDPSDADYISFKDAVGKENFSDTIQGAIDKCTDDQNDYVMVCPKASNAVWALTSAVDMNKARVHLISVGYTKATYGYTNELTGFATDSTEDEIIHVTAEGCEIAGFRLHGTCGTGSAGTIDNGLLYLSGSAHNLWVHDCAIETSGTAWTANLPAGAVAGAASQHGARFDNCTIGGLVISTDGSQVPVTCSASGKRWEFNDCKFLMLSGHVGQKFVVAGTGAIDYTLLNRCKFINTDATNAVTSCVSGIVTADQGQVLMDYCTGVNVLAFGTNANTRVSPNIHSGTSVFISNPNIALIGTAALPTV